MTDVREATHVKRPDGVIEKIASKWGIDINGRFAKPSRGGFGVVTESGVRVNMWEALCYYNEGKEMSPKKDLSLGAQLISCRHRNCSLDYTALTVCFDCGSTKRPEETVWAAPLIWRYLFRKAIGPPERKEALNDVATGMATFQEQG